MGFIRKVRSVFRLARREYQWHCDAKRFRTEMPQKALMEPPQGRLLVLMPHSDDEWIGCARILLCRSKEVLVLDMNMDGGDDEGLHLRRREEAVSAAEKYGYRFVTAHDRYEDLVKIITEEKPSCVFLPCFLDWHEEHIAVMDLFRKAAIQTRYAGLVGMYQVSLPIPFKMINSGMAMTKKQWKEKWHLMKSLYGSQSFLPVKRFAWNEYINGGTAGAYAVEAYCVLDFEIWKTEYGRNSLSMEEKRFLKDNLQNMEIVRKYIEENGGVK